MSDPQPYRMSPLDLAWGMVLGEDPAPPDLPEATGIGPLAALETVMVPHLRRPPCFVSFSGGRDSSLLLAVAVRLARRLGLDEPVPITCRFPNVPAMEESEWQETVVRHTGVAEWVVLHFDDELDCLGPYASAVMGNHGLLWPFNSHLHAPLYEQASGGSLLTGAGGDEVHSPSSHLPVATALSGRRKVNRRDVIRIGFALSPRLIREAVFRRRFPGDFQWLTEDAQQEIARAWAAEAGSKPFWWNASRRWWRRRHYVRLMTESLGLIAADYGVTTTHPFADLRFVAEAAAAGGRAGFDTRADALRSFYGDCLPDQIYSRASKASGNLVFWSRHSREFAAAWGGDGVDETTVDIGALRREWESPVPDPHTLSLLQAAWLSTRKSSS